MSYALWLAAAYLVGATPTSYVAGRLARGIDLRDHGSKNLGATNVYRLLGWGWAIPVAIIDVAKGAIPVLLFAGWAHGPAWLAVALGGAAVLGHVYSPWVGFKGGKGVATAGGMFLALAPLAVVIALPVWAVVVWLTGYVSAGSITTAALFPLWVRLTRPGIPEVWYASLGLAALIVYTHRANIRRLATGTENRVGRSGAGAA